MSTGDDTLWTALDVAKFIKASRSWVYLHAEDGTLPSVRIAGLRRFIPSEIKAFARGETSPAANVVPFKGGDGR